MVGIYKFTNKYDRKTYVGKSKNIIKRYNSHIQNAKNGNKGYFYNAIRKYGIDAFDFDILIECPVENLDYWEKFYIKYYCSNIYGYGYNETEGGDGVVNRSDSSREKCRNSAINRFKNPEEREKASIAAKNRFKNPAEREKVRQEQYNRLKNSEYHDFLCEIARLGAAKRKENLKNDSIKRKEMSNKISDKRKLYFKNMSESEKNEWKQKLSDAHKKFQKTEKYVHPTAGKHRVYDDETHTKYHYEK